ncbi:EpsG family protein, partial [Paenibacillus sp. NPDC056579]|uniref:EpsG family protein n=1 Tax=Paenibacillus sp. NPDC056579 TaxID=3345871 RepID=UPI0036C9ED14
MESTFFYMFVFLASSIMISWAQKSKSSIIGAILLILSCLIPVFVLGLRYDVGTDYFSYIDMYNYLSVIDFKLVDIINYTSVEPGYIILNIIADKLFGNYQAVFFLAALITMLFSFLSIWYYKDKIFLGVTLFIYFIMIFPITFNAVRQSIAVAIIFFAIRYID